MKLLICSLTVPYDTVAHGGGQTHNYYLKRLKKIGMDVHIVTFSSPGQIEEIDLDTYNISNKVIHEWKKQNLFDSCVRKILTLIYRCYPKITYWDFYSNYRKYLMWKELKKIKLAGYSPDVIELNWTQIVFFYPMIHRIFPDAKFYAVEQDVSFLKYKREYENGNNKNKLSKAFLKYFYIKKTEINLLSKLDKIFVFNTKDKNLLLENNILASKIIVISPFFKKLSFPVTTKKKKSILFYGAMSREENYSAAIWFIKNVFSQFVDTNLIFTVLGSNPNQELLQYQSNNIIITGYQPDIQPYFEEALCLVCPLILGAGIKIKVLEALSAGIPVLGSDVASEGIPVTDGINFYNCKNPDDYIEKITYLYRHPEIRNSMGGGGGLTAQNLINQNFNFDVSFEKYANTIYSLGGK